MMDVVATPPTGPPAATLALGPIAVPDVLDGVRPFGRAVECLALRTSTPLPVGVARAGAPKHPICGAPQPPGLNFSNLGHTPPRYSMFSQKVKDIVLTDAKVPSNARSRAPALDVLVV